VPEFIIGGRSVPQVELVEEALSQLDAVVLVTDHSKVDYDVVVRYAPLVLDTRNALKSYDGGTVVRL
jgi:UDP-N-acetyl-D-glucosamine dehydrogenase